MVGAMSDSEPPAGDREELGAVEAYHTRIDVAEESVPDAVLTVIAAIENVRRTDLPILYDAVDPDALEALLASATGPLSVTFRYHDYRIEITAEGYLSVESTST